MDARKRSAQKEMKKISYRTLSLSFKVFFVLFILFLSTFLWGLSQIPSDKAIRSCFTTRMYKVYLCPNSGHYSSLTKISPYLQKAIILNEDSSFWTHHGFDLHEIQNSLKSNLEKGRFARGGSTITQQLAKNMFLSREKTLLRKILEAIVTVRLEKVLNKREIFEKYLNVIQFGKNIYGIQPAAAFYFKKSPENLNLVESVFLSFLLPNPEIYSKSFYKQELTPFARKRL